MVVTDFPMPVRGGAQKQAYLLAKSLAGDGHSVIAVGRRFYTGQKVAEHSNGVKVIRLCFGSGVFRIFDGAYQLLLPFFLYSRRNEFDIVHVHTIKIAGLIAIVIAKLLGKKTLQKIPVVGYYHIFQSWKKLSGAIRKVIFSFCADAIVSLSAKSVQELKSCGYPETRIFRVTNGVEIDKYVPRGNASNINNLNIVFMGRLSRTKGIFDLLDAWKIVLSTYGEKRIELNIFGQGSIETLIQNTIDDNMLNSSVTLCGHTDNVHGILDATDIFVLPSYEEGNSNAVLEAMVAGVPIISTNVGGTANLVGNVGREFLHEPGDIKTLSEIMLKLIRDNNLRIETGLKMRERVLKYFSMAEIKDKYVFAYKLLLKGKRDVLWNCSDYPPD